ncbi:MAG: alpha-amylase family glycosyl hydrolase [Halobacteriota archaeon]
MVTTVESVRELDLTPHGEVFPSPRDWRDQFIYFLLVDRFDNKEDTIPPYDPKTAPRGRNSEQAGKFQGGNLKGITRRLDYIRNLGCRAIWLSPIFKNRQEKSDTYHGYGIQHFLEIDKRFGPWNFRIQNVIREEGRSGIGTILIRLSTATSRA